MAENKSANTERIEAEAEGFFKGERKEQINNAAEKIVEMLKKEELSITQARQALGIASRKVEKTAKILLASTTVE